MPQAIESVEEQKEQEEFEVDLRQEVKIQTTLIKLTLE